MYHHHANSFRHKEDTSEKERPNYILTLNEDKLVPYIKWKVSCIAPGKRTSNYFRYCFPENFFIIKTLWDNRALSKYVFDNKCC